VTDPQGLTHPFDDVANDQLLATSRFHFAVDAYFSRLNPQLSLAARSNETFVL
jgi:hypothetical protein